MKTEESAYDFLSGPSAPARGTVTSAVTDTLRRAIVSLEMRPGAPIDKSAICARLGVSRFPVSEALARLSAEGLVDILPQRGSVVSLVRVADVLECALIRRALECEAVGLLATTEHPGLVESLNENLERQRQAESVNDLGDFHAADVRFHEMLFEALRLPRLRAIIDSARANLDRARQLINTRRPIAHPIREHEAVVAALATGDARAASGAMRGHLDTLITGIVEFAREQPALFADGGEDFTHRFAALFPRG